MAIAPAPALAALAPLLIDGVHFAPIRHHSPACALAVQALIREVRPAAVLIEGPDDFNALLPLLLDAATRPPVAILAQATAPTGRDDPDAARSVFYPFCDYSPEWVALHEGRAAGAQLAFIDRPWRPDDDRNDRNDSDDDQDIGNLMSERYLAHSDYLKALAARTGCRDQDELWDHLFELRDGAALRDWRHLFADVHAYCAMARNDYEPVVLEAEGSLPRERHMAAHLRAWRARVDGPIVVVTGGFHTTALQRMLHAPETAPAVRDSGAGKRLGSWLIRYSFDRLDALSGYASGMPSPAYYQRVWESANATADGPLLADVAAGCLTGLARISRELGLSEQISTAGVQAAVVQAVRLADLRGHAGPGRQDLLDAVRSCFIKGAIDDGTSGMAADIHRYLGGSKIGDIPPSAGSPPLLEDARRTAAHMRINLDDSTARTVRLDLYRKDRHRARSRFLHLMAYLDTGLARWQSGPDFIGGSSLDLLMEEWRVAWSPLVEARLIECSPLGATLQAVAMARLRRDQAALAAQGQGRSASAAVSLLTRACVIGLHQQLPSLLQLVADLLDEDSNAASVITCSHRLLLLWRGRELLGLQEHPQLRALLLQAWNTALYLVPQLAQAKPEDEAAAIGHLRTLRTLHGALRQLADDRAAGVPAAGAAAAESPAAGVPVADGPAAGDPATDDPAASAPVAGITVSGIPAASSPAPGHTSIWQRQLQALATAIDGAPGVRSAAAATLFIDGAWTDTELAAMLQACFGPGALPGDAVRGLAGLMAVAPELLLTQAGLRAQVSAIVAGWDEQTFIDFLPDLRQAFTLLKPQETAHLAEALVGKQQLTLAETHYTATEADLLAGVALQARLAASVARDGLAAWLTTGATS